MGADPTGFVLHHRWSAARRVLEHNGFVRFGTAPAYLRIAGRWQDHVLYQVLNHAMPDGKEPASTPRRARRRV